MKSKRGNPTNVYVNAKRFSSLSVQFVDRCLRFVV
jgi:hypothetical protein